MALRCVWVINLSKENFGKILLVRKFPTVEKKCKKDYEDGYVPIPSPPIFCCNLLVKLGLSVEAKRYVQWRDKASGNMQLPVTEVTINRQVLWPVVAIAQNSVLVCCLPFVENFKSIDKTNLLSIPSVSVGFSVLLGILDFLSQPPNTQTDKPLRLMELDNFLTVTMPFGTPSDAELSSAMYLHKHHTHKFSKKQPAWKPFEYKGKQQIHFKIMEFVRCVLSDQSGGIRHLEVFGKVSMRADLEGAANEVGLTLTSTEPGQPLFLDSLILHPCVNNYGGPSTLGSNFNKRIRFTPPLHEIVLFSYCSPIPKEPPVQGVFKMLGENSVELLVQLKLSEKVKNNFDFCDLIIVFFNRGPVRNIEFNANHGTPRLTEDKYSLRWFLGTKFPKDLEAALTAKLEFQDEPILPNSDPFCFDKNCYAQLNFKQSNYNLSGCTIDAKNVTVSEGHKPKILIERSVQSTEYRIWNNYGELPFSVNITDKFKDVFK